MEMIRWEKLGCEIEGESGGIKMNENKIFSKSGNNKVMKGSWIIRILKPQPTKRN